MSRAHAINELATGVPQQVQAQRSWHDALLLGVAYTLVQGGILLVPGAVFWDDWLLFRSSPQAISEMFRDAGALFNAVTYLHLGMLALGMWSYKVLTFVLWFGSGLLLDRILQRTGLFPRGARLAVVLLFLVLPFNAARVAAINFPSTLTCFFFFLAWQLLDTRRIAALLLFALSFFTPSLLMFYALPMLDLAWRQGAFGSFAAMLRFAARRLDFMLLPFAFFGLRLLTFDPSGTYAGYQSHYSLDNVRNALKVQWLEFSLDMPLRLDLLLIAVLLPVAWLLLQRSGWSALAQAPVGRRRALAWLVLGVLAFVLGGFPYWVLGLLPLFAEWYSRHQLLLPLGTALVLVSLLWMLPRGVRTAAMSALLAVCLSFGAVHAYALWVDWHKQMKLVELFQREPQLRAASAVVFVDRSTYLNALDRQYRFYDWGGLMEMAFGDQTRFGMNASDAKAYGAGRMDAYLQRQYKASGHRRDPQAGALQVEILAEPAAATGPGYGIWRWPPLPPLQLRLSQLPPQALRAEGS